MAAGGRHFLLRAADSATGLSVSPLSAWVCYGLGMQTKHESPRRIPMAVTIIGMIMLLALIVWMLDMTITRVVTAI
jgi:hypothetical protein